MSRPVSILVLVSLAACASPQEPVTTPATHARGGTRPEASSLPLEQARVGTCETGSVAACEAIEEVIVRGAHDVGAARARLREACAASAVAACPSLARVAFDRDATRDRERVVRALDDACATDTAACIVLGSLLTEADLPPDGPKALGLFERACEAGDMRGCAWLGDLVRMGAGVERDLDRARTMYTRACDGGHFAACGALGHLMLWTLATDHDVEDAVAALGRGCEGGHRGACTQLLDLADAHVTGVPSPDEVDARFALGCRAESDERACAAPTRVREEQPTGMCALPRGAADQPSARAALVRALERLARGASIATRSMLDPRAVALIERTVFPLGCSEGDVGQFRYVRPLRRDADGSMLALVEWYAASGDPSAEDDGGALHETLIRIGPSGIRIADDASLAWHYTSLGLGSLARATDRDIDLDGLRDVLVATSAGLDDVLSDYVFVISSRRGRVDLVPTASAEQFDSRGCISPAASGPTLWLSVEAPNAPDDYDGPSRSCLAAITFDGVSGPLHPRVSARLGPIVEVPFDLEARAHFGAIRQILAASNRGVRLVGLPEVVRSRHHHHDEAAPLRIDDERTIRSVSAFPFPMCPANAAFVLASTPADADDAPPLRARVAFEATVATGTPDAPAFPETTREPFCNRFR